MRRFESQSIESFQIEIAPTQSSEINSGALRKRRRYTMLEKWRETSEIDAEDPQPVWAASSLRTEPSGRSSDSPYCSLPCASCLLAVGRVIVRRRSYYSVEL